MKSTQALKKALKSLKNALEYRLTMSSKERQNIANEYHTMVYDAGVQGRAWGSGTWFGVPCRKLPFDLWAYQEIVTKIKPDLIIETGTFKGGSALYLAHLCDLLGHGKVITVDVTDHGNRPTHPRISYAHGSSTDPAIVQQITTQAQVAKRVLIILDSDHSEQHVAKELEAYAPLVTKDSYIIVEDTNVNGHPVFTEHGPGPHEALEKFLRTHKNFVTDKTLEKFFVSFNVDGYLKRVF